MLDIAVLLCCILMYVLNAAGVFILDSSKILLLTLAILPFSAFSFIIGTLLKIEKAWVKYMIILDECAIILMAYSVLSMHVIMILVLPLLKASLYFNKKVTVITYVVSSAMLLIGHIASVYFSIVFDDPVIVSLPASLIYGFLPRFCQLTLVFLFLIFIARNSAKMQSDGYVYAEKTKRLMESTRTNHYEIVKNLATISENKSADNGGHIQRVFKYMQILAKRDGAYDETAYNIGLAAMLHDVGKLAISETILSKPARLTEEEFAEVKKHAAYGKALLSGSDNEIIKLAAVIADEHHERWDGKGYHGLKGDEINKYSCMMSVVDVFDALASRRCYKEPWDIDSVYKEIVGGRGTQFSPVTVDMFCESFDEFMDVYREYKDT